MSIKKAVHAACMASVNVRIESIREAIADAQEAANEETKSSSGDKYETGRAMMQLETEKLNGQLEQALADMERLRRISPLDILSHVTEGALVETDKRSFYLAVPAGNHKIENREIISISPGSPVGMACEGMKKGDTFTVRDITYNILNIY